MKARITCALALVAVGGATSCSSDSAPESAPNFETGGAALETGGNASGGNAATSGGAATFGGRAGTGGRPTTSGGRADTGGVREPGTGGRAATGGDVSSAGAADAPAPGACGLAEPAFCDGFDGAPRDGGRSGELDPAVWSGARGMPVLHPNPREPFVIGPALIPECRDGVSGQRVYSDRDALLCDPISTLQSPHLLLTAAAQNYGLTSYRVRQPFDFADRTGTLVFDVDLTSNALGAWPAVSLSEEPTPLPSFDDPERGSGPRNGFQIDFGSGAWCGRPDTAVFQIRTYREFEEQLVFGSDDWDCSAAWPLVARDALNHVELRVSPTQLEVWVSDVSTDGESYAEPRLLHEQPLELPFTRGYLNLVVRNHATIKYWAGAAGLTRWDNVGFDGPVVPAAREYSAPDANVAHPGLPGCDVAGSCDWIGDVIPNQDHCAPEAGCSAEGDSRATGSVLSAIETADAEPVVLTFSGVDTIGATRARLAIAADYPWFSWNDVFPAPTALALHYRVNGGALRDRFIADSELPAFLGPYDGAGILNQIVELDLAELVDGTNTIELWSKGTWTGSYAVAVTAADLIIDP